ncbi:MAG: response regulator, partial [Lachnospiraceae bacterium]
MYKVLFVDDEILTRQSISRNTPWEEAGFTLVGAAENGKQAIEMVEEKLPDLVLTDICMPIMDGIGLASYIHEKHPEIKVVILSGYDDFDYAKSALKYEVIDYILKPITSFELKEELEKIREKMD